MQAGCLNTDNTKTLIVGKQIIPKAIAKLDCNLAQSNTRHQFQSQFIFSLALSVVLMVHSMRRKLCLHTECEQFAHHQYINSFSLVFMFLPGADYALAYAISWFNLFLLFCCIFVANIVWYHQFRAIRSTQKLYWLFITIYNYFCSTANLCVINVIILSWLRIMQYSIGVFYVPWWWVSFRLISFQCTKTPLE